MGEQPGPSQYAPVTVHLFTGEALNFFINAQIVTAFSEYLMEGAARILGEEVAWPQISFMSAYPDDVRNGYLLFAFAVLATVFLSSGVFAAYAGASIGKALVGIRYVDAVDGEFKPRRVQLRARLLILLLLPILLAGPLIGFEFGPAGDVASLFALGVSCIAFFWFALRTDALGTTWVNRKAGVKPVLRFKAR
jgi:hypothetical protein